MSVVVVKREPYFTDAHVESYIGFINEKNAVETSLSQLFENILDLEPNKNKYFSKKDVESALKKHIRATKRESSIQRKKVCNDAKKMSNQAYRSYEKKVSAADKYNRLGLSELARDMNSHAEVDMGIYNSFKKILDETCKTEI